MFSFLAGATRWILGGLALLVLGLVAWHFWPSHTDGGDKIPVVVKEDPEPAKAEPVKPAPPLSPAALACGTAEEKCLSVAEKAKQHALLDCDTGSSCVKVIEARAAVAAAICGATKTSCLVAAGCSDTKAAAAKQVAKVCTDCTKPVKAHKATGGCGKCDDKDSDPPAPAADPPKDTSPAKVGVAKGDSCEGIEIDGVKNPTASECRRYLSNLSLFAKADELGKLRAHE
jgi:hypothetical protein